MNSNLIGWSVIGTPGGMQTKSYGCISNFDIGNFVDVNNLAIKLFPNTEMLCLFRENRNNSFINYYTLYKYAKEIKTDRPGTFCGGVLVVVNNIIKGDIVLQFLQELIENVSNYLTSDKRFKINISNVDFPVPASLNIVESSLEPVSNLNVGKIEGIVPLQNNNKNTMAGFFDFASKPSLGTTFSRIYASSNVEIINYVKERGLIKLIDPVKIGFELEITQLKSEINFIRNQKDNLQKEKEHLEGELNNKTTELINTITIQEKLIENLNFQLVSKEDYNKLNEISTNKEKENNLLVLKNEQLKEKINKQKIELEQENNRYANYASPVSNEVESLSNKVEILISKVEYLNNNFEVYLNRFKEPYANTSTKKENYNLRSGNNLDKQRNKEIKRFKDWANEIRDWVNKILDKPLNATFFIIAVVMVVAFLYLFFYFINKNHISF